MRKRTARKIVLILLALGLLVPLMPLQESIHKARPELFDPDRKVRAGSAIGSDSTPAVIAALGGFRTVAADLLWLRAERVWHGGDWWAMPRILEAVTELDPHFILAWQVYGWHCAYNLHAESETQVDRDYWLGQGIQVFERAVEANPDNWEIIFELGWTLHDRAREHRRAAEYFLRADQYPEAKPYVSRLRYKCYEAVLDIPKLMDALEYAKTRHTDLNDAGDRLHQQLVNRDYDWWTQHKDDKEEHRRQIVRENDKRGQRAIPYYLYPDNPYWDVCPECGLPSEKGSDVCQYCHAPLKDVNHTRGAIAPAASAGERT